MSSEWQQCKEKFKSGFLFDILKNGFARSCLDVGSGERKSGWNNSSAIIILLFTFQIILLFTF